MGIMKRLPDIALLRRLPVCSCFSRRSPQGSPVDMGCSADDKTQVTGVNIVQIAANTGEPAGAAISSKDSGPPQGLGSQEQPPSSAHCALPSFPQDSSVPRASDIPEQIQFSTAMANSQSGSIPTNMASSSKPTDFYPSTDNPLPKVDHALSRKAALAALQLTLLVILLSVVRLYSNVKAAAHSCRHRLTSTGAAAAAGAAISSWCSSMSSLTSRLCAWLAIKAQRGQSLPNSRMRLSGSQLLLSLLWFLALANAFQTDAGGCAASCGLISIPTLTGIAADTRAARAIRRAAITAASHILSAAIASAPLPLSWCMKFGCAYATARLTAMCKWPERFRSVTITRSLHLSSSGRQAVQACTVYSKSAVTVMTSPVCVILGCFLMASVLTLPSLVLDRCATVLVQCWPCLLVLSAYKVLRSLDEWQTGTRGTAQTCTLVTALSTAYVMQQVCAHIKLALAACASAASMLQQKFFPDARLSQSNAELASAQRQLSQQAAELDMAQQQLSLQSTQLSSASQGLCDKDAQLDRADQELAVRNVELVDANQKLSAKEAELMAEQQAFAAQKAEGMTFIQRLSQQNAKAKSTNEKLITQLTSTKQKLASRDAQYVKSNQMLLAKERELAQAEQKLVSLEALLTGKQFDLGLVNAELVNANQKVAEQAEQLAMLSQQQGTPSLSKESAQRPSKEASTVSAAQSPTQDLQVMAAAQALPDSVLSVRASHLHQVTGTALPAPCAHQTLTPGHATHSALQEVYSNPLFLAEGALPPTQLNKLSDSATVADSTAEGSTAIASLQIHQDAACASAAGSASGLEKKSAEQTSASESGSQLQMDQATTFQSASGLQREQDSVAGPSAELPIRLQDQQDSGRAAAASSASTSGRHVQAACKLPGTSPLAARLHGSTFSGRC